MFGQTSQAWESPMILGEGFSMNIPEVEFTLAFSVSSVICGFPHPRFFLKKNYLMHFSSLLGLEHTW